MSVSILVGDVREQLRTLASDSINCVVTSPPYWGLRDYGVEGQIGLESSPAEFIATMIDVFEEVRRVLRPDGTCWINMGDSYVNKMMVGMPWRLALAMQDAGWLLRQDIIWSKPNPMPESVRDRCTKSHEYIFLLTKSERYYYDAEAIKEPVVGDPDASRNRFDTKDYEVPGQKPQKRLALGVGFGHGTDAEERDRGRVKRVPSGWATGTDRSHTELAGNFSAQRKTVDADVSRRMGREPGWRKNTEIPTVRNKRSVWTMATHSFKEAHFATFPPELPETCIKAGCPVGGTVLDPFFGAGTTGLVADRLQRNCIGIELNPVYAEIARKRIHLESTLFAEVKVAA